MNNYTIIIYTESKIINIIFIYEYELKNKKKLNILSII